MIKQLELVLLPEEAADQSKQLQQASSLANVRVDRIKSIRLLKRSIDARGKVVKIRLIVEITIDEIPKSNSHSISKFQFTKDVSNANEVFIIGFGPAGMFAALKLIEAGIKPVIIERGKNVKQRRRDLALINREGIVDGDSNYCFGEGGAGTYSDGTLYTRSNKRGDVNRILDILIEHGADPDIRIDAHPHIVTNKLPHLVESILQTILDAGGEIQFETRLEDIVIKNNRIIALILRNLVNDELTERSCEKVILATGHSASDIYRLLDKRNIKIEAKPFALGIRIEHPQEIIDKVQYHCDTRSSFLPPASYSLTHQFEGRGVYSFCMCPGGIIAPAATAPGEIVVNGWSPSKRNNPFANSGMVVSIEEKDYQIFKEHGNLAALQFQQNVEQQAFQFGGGNLKAPGQRLIDFVTGKVSKDLPICSYHPGTTSVDLTTVLPNVVSLALKDALASFGKKMKSYYTNEAILVATESRTSSPVRIPRDSITLQHPEIIGLFPCGEGAGYAGGIVSAAMDGENCATAACGQE